MKKTIFTTLFAGLFILSSANAQDSEVTDKDDFSKWQARFRIISVMPSEDIEGGGDLDISTSFVPELDFTYFFTENFAAELILATTRHNVDLADTDLGHVWLLPPTLNLQYHFNADELRPYFGAGINYTIFYGADAGDLDDIDYDSSVGFSLQAGMDFDLNDIWFLNLDIKKLFLKTDVTANNSSESAEVTIDPLVIGVGVGMKF